MVTGWKYSKERLKKHPYVAKVLCAKKVICVCGAIIKLSRKWDEDYINRHTRSKACTRVEGQKTLYDYFNTNKKCNDDSDEEWQDWNSEVENAIPMKKKCLGNVNEIVRNLFFISRKCL